MTRVLVLGGYGVFGNRAVERLVRHAPGSPNLSVIIAGRNGAAAKAAAARWKAVGAADVTGLGLDATAITPEDIVRNGIAIVINAVGPYQAHDYRVARAAIQAKAHYVDLADARAFVTGIGALDQEAKAAGVLVASGASSVPALSAAVVDHLLPKVPDLRTVTYAISPGNSFDPGLGTTQSVFASVGQPIKTLQHGRTATVYGWQPIHALRWGDLDTRLLGPCDAPDLDLFPSRYPTLQTLNFWAGVEVKSFHVGLWALSWLVRAGFLHRPERLAPAMLAVKRHLTWLGSDRGGMVMRLEGLNPAGRPVTLEWALVAGSGHGPFIPPTPAVLIARGLANSRIQARGAMPALGLITLDDFTAEVADLDIRHATSETP